MHRRLLAALALLTSAVCATPALAADDPLGEINALRDAYGAPALSPISTPDLEAAVIAAHDRDTGVASGLGLPDCVVCDSRALITWSRYGQEYSARLITAWGEATGSTRDFIVITFPRSASIRESIDRHPMTAAYLLSPVLSGTSVLARAGNADIMLIERQPDTPAGPLRMWPDAPQVTPGSNVVVFGGEGSMLQVIPTAGRFTGRGDTLPAQTGTPEPTWTGLGYAIVSNARYTLRAGSATRDITTAAAARPAGPPTFAPSVTRAQRTGFLRASRSKLPLARELWGYVAPRVTVERSTKCGGAQACSSGGMGYARIRMPGWMFSPAHRFTVHSLQGLTTWMIAIPEEGAVAFNKIIRSSKKYRCIKIFYAPGLPAGCAGPDAYFREEYARWATGERGASRLPRIMSRAQMTRFLQTWFYLPPAQNTPF